MSGFNIFLAIMAGIAVIVFFTLYHITAGYGKFVTGKWGITVNNKLGWVLMESPVFILMTILWICSDRALQPAILVIFILFQLHYFQRSFIFPLILKGKSRMPVTIVAMGALFNMLNAAMQGGWLFYISEPDRYGVQWLCTPQFICGTIIFLAGMAINIHSDSVIRHLRKDPADTGHYLPAKGLYRYVTSANYFGEFMEWCGFALLTWSWAGAVFALWTFANLVPRSDTIYKRYKTEFKEQMQNKKLKRIFPYIY